MAGPWEKYADKPKATGGAAPWEKYAAAEPETSAGDAALIGVQKGASFGTRPAISGAGAAVGSFIGRMGANVPGEGLLERLKASASMAGEAFSEQRENAITEQAKASIDQPGASIGGELAGAVLTAPFTAVRGLKGAALLGAAAGAGQAIGESNDIGDAALKVGVGGITGLAVPIALGMGGKAIKYGAGKIASGSKSAGKKAITAFLGPNREAIDRYLSRADEIRGAKSVEEIKNVIDSTMAGFFDDVERSKIGRDEAKEALKKIEDRIKETTREAGFDFRVKQSDLKESLRDAHNRLEDAYKAETGKLSAIKSPIQMSDDVQMAVQDLKQKVIKGSGEAYEILDRDPQAYSVRKAAPILRQIADEMNIKSFEGPITSENKALVSPGQWGKVKAAASAPVTAETASVQSQIRSFADRLENTPEMVPARELKKIMQQIDASGKAKYGDPGFDERVSQAYKMVRATIDDIVKTRNPEYAAKMQEVAANAGLLDKAIGKFGSSQSTVSALNTINSRTAGESRKILSDIGKSTERDFDSPISEFANAQAVLKNPEALESIRRRLPQFSEARMRGAEVERLARPEALPEFVQARISSSGLNESKEVASAGLTESIARLRQAEDALQPFKTKLGPNNSQSSIQALLRSPGKENIETRRALEELSKMSGQDFIGAIADRRAADAFKGEFRMGSRNVNLWGLFGGATAGIPGAGIGAAVGAITDRFGPQMAQKILDGVLEIRGAPSVQKITAMNLPPQVKEYLTRSLVQAQGGISALQESTGSDAISRRLRLIKAGNQQDQNEQ